MVSSPTSSSNPFSIAWGLEKKVKRLNSLLFGVDLAFSKGDTDTALGLGLRLLGFLESQCQTAEDVVYVEPIQRKVLQKLNLATLVDRRQALEQAKTPADFKFKQHRPIDIEKIKASKYYMVVLNWSKGNKEGETTMSSQSTLMHSPLSGILKILMHLMLQALRITKNTSISSVPAASLRTAGDANYHGVCESGRVATKPGQSLTQSKIMSLYSNASHKAVEPTKGQTGKEIGSDEDAAEAPPTSFVTASHKLAIDALKKNGCPSSLYQGSFTSSGPPQTGLVKTLGMSRRGVRGSFVPPVRGANGSSSGSAVATAHTQGGTDNGYEESTRKCIELLAGPDGKLPDRLQNLEPRLLEHVSNEIMDQDPAVHWDDIAGLEHAKKCVTEMVIWPLLRPDIFQGCRAPGRGLLLFGPPGTGKTMIGKAIAGEARATFFSISASSLTSKWIGEGEKLVRALFGVASCRQPAVIFIDEIDSLLSQRKAEGEHESSRRIKTQFLIEMEGCGSGTEQILLIGATNRPQELDEAVRRRLSKRLYIPLPSSAARAWIVRNLLGKDGLLSLTDAEIESICTSTDGYSASDMKNLVKEASMGPLREALMQGREIGNISKDEMRPISVQDFMTALQQVRPSVSESEVGVYQDWNRQFGSLATETNSQSNLSAI
ncbi:unnamed protein product [Sphagnum jensenii]|uniref:AAA+ ATPase domain-containing protein n=1 Tax=Sphagnum jensenii TaxID=128206 RepID=A0ABP1AZU9_9BRYO